LGCFACGSVGKGVCFCLCWVRLPDE
jgi:hypothetical protein